jgi:hypothetical protein
MAVRCFAVTPKNDIANNHGEPSVAIKRCIDHRHFYGDSAAKLSLRLYSTCRRIGGACLPRAGWRRNFPLQDTV